nr:MAG TPA: hypothetical protein [Caudoviricetes sp.]
MPVGPAPAGFSLPTDCARLHAVARGCTQLPTVARDCTQLHTVARCDWDITRVSIRSAARAGVRVGCAWKHR